MPFEWIGTAFALCGALFVALGVLGLRQARAFARRAVRAEGEVVDVEWSGHGRVSGPAGRSWLAFPVLRYTTADGQTLEARADIGRSPAAARVGERVEVLYDPGRPPHVRLARGGGASLLYGLFVALGGVLVLIGLAVTALIALVSEGLP